MRRRKKRLSATEEVIHLTTIRTFGGEKRHPLLPDFEKRKKRKQLTAAK